MARDSCLASSQSPHRPAELGLEGSPGLAPGQAPGGSHQQHRNTGLLAKVPLPDPHPQKTPVGSVKGAAGDVGRASTLIACAGLEPQAVRSQVMERLLQRRPPACVKWEALWEKRHLTSSGSIRPPGDLRSPVLFPPPDTTVRRFASLLPFSKRTKG